MQVEMLMADSLVRILMFLIVQTLVYFILSNSSHIFSDNKMTRSLSFRPPRSLSIRRVLASISDLPQGVEPSPSAATEELTQEI
ncbi:hypothetical protein HRI_002288300 [Hibiscus trionum]|uniref:Uncharacterized protein n=1 Tax=Hibiscus trionum TaxID=183268 RepID=A0A9W7HXD7_HIBTR|nr:hypothetical protein HRI_002288300 [Hibiscus trionum]